MSAARPPNVSVVPPLMTDWPTYDQCLAWMERMRTLLEGAGVWTVELQASLGQLCGEVLECAAGRTPTRPKVHAAQRPPRRPIQDTRRAERNGGPSTPVTTWTVSERAEALGYPTLARKDRIALGQRVVAAYRAQHGRIPPVMAHGRGSGARRAARYTATDLLLIDAVLRDHLGEPPAEARLREEAV